MQIGPYFSTLLVCVSTLSGCAEPPDTTALTREAKSGTTNAWEEGTVSSPPGARSSIEAYDGAKLQPPMPAPALCAPPERALFSCVIKNSRKTAAICASKDVAETKGYLYYVYGTPERKELIYPADKSPPAGRFKRTHLTYAGNTGGYAYSFANKGIKYIIYSVSGADGLAGHGVMALRGDSRTPLATQDCREGTVVQSDDEDLIDLTIGWSEDAAISRQGLPGRN